MVPAKLTSTSCEGIFILLPKNWKTQDSSVSVVIRLRVGRFEVQVPAGATDFALLQNAQALSGAHPASCLVSTGGLFNLVQSGRAVKLTTDLHLVPSLRLTVAVPLLVYLYLFIRLEQHK